MEFDELIRRLIEESNARVANGPLTWKQVGEIIAAHEVVFAVWPLGKGVTKGKGGEIGFRIIKGRSLVHGAAGTSTGLTVSAAAVNCRSEAEANRLQKDFSDDTKH